MEDILEGRNPTLRPAAAVSVVRADAAVPAAGSGDIPEHFNIGVACTDAHLGIAASRRATR